MPAGQDHEHVIALLTLSPEQSAEPTAVPQSVKPGPRGRRGLGAQSASPGTTVCLSGHPAVPGTFVAASPSPTMELGLSSGLVPSAPPPLPARG